MTTLGSRLLDAAFGTPRGLLGRLGGAVMARGNADQERQAVRRAALRAGDRVLVLGHGPGVGLAEAAAAVGPGGHVLGLDPSPLMRDLTARRCAREIAAGTVEVRSGTAEDTGCPDASVDAGVSVNNVMLWDRPAGFAEVVRVLRPGGRLVVSVHRHVLDTTPEHLGRGGGRRFHRRRDRGPAPQAQQPGDRAGGPPGRVAVMCVRGGF